MKNYYKILGVSERATDKEVHSAYRALAKQYHPDIKKGSEEAFKDLAEAYEILKDHNKRELYDALLASGGLSESKTMIESIFNGYLMSVSAGVLFLYSVILLFIGVVIFKGSIITILLALILVGAGFYLKYKSFIR